LIVFEQILASAIKSEALSEDGNIRDMELVKDIEPLPPKPVDDSATEGTGELESTAAEDSAQPSTSTMPPQTPAPTVAVKGVSARTFEAYKRWRDEETLDEISGTMKVKRVTVM
jgi:hypothetical protein